MELKPETKLFDLLKEHPFLLDFLVGYNPEYRKLRNPVVRNTLGRMATLDKVAELGNVPVDKLIADISQAIENPPEDMQDRAKRKQALKELLRQLHDGVPLDQLKPRFAEIAGDVSPSEIGAIEQELVREGLNPQDITKLCNLHVQLFQEAMERKMAEQFPGGHPLRTFQEENQRIAQLISQFKQSVENRAREQIARSLDSLSLLNQHYIRKENALFPLLEKYGISAPSQVMWAVHDEIRSMLKQARELLQKNDLDGLATVADKLVSEAEQMINKEENILFPMLMETVAPEEWVDLARKPVDTRYKSGVSAGLISLETGKLSPTQINLILKNLPVDITFVDENDEVRYYSEGERIFPRSPEIIGRKVQNCHPPKSVHIVQKILDEFKAGKRDVAEFWLTVAGRFVHIRYFAVRDEKGEYKGTLEVSQDITHIKELEGEKRLLDWE